MEEKNAEGVGGEGRGKGRGEESGGYLRGGGRGGEGEESGCTCLRFLPSNCKRYAVIPRGRRSGGGDAEGVGRGEGRGGGRSLGGT